MDDRYFRVYEINSYIFFKNISQKTFNIYLVFFKSYTIQCVKDIDWPSALYNLLGIIISVKYRLDTLVPAVSGHFPIIWVGKVKLRYELYGIYGFYELQLKLIPPLNFTFLTHFRFYCPF